MNRFIRNPVFRAAFLVAAVAIAPSGCAGKVESLHDTEDDESSDSTGVNVSVGGALATGGTGGSGIGRSGGAPAGGGLSSSPSGGSMGGAEVGGTGNEDSSGGASASGGSGGETEMGGAAGEMIEPTWSNVALILTSGSSCTSSDCHGGRHTYGGFVAANKDKFYDALLTYVSRSCDNRTLVVPGDPEMSALPQLIGEGCEAANGELVRMPSYCMRTEEDDSCIPMDWVEVVSEWIAKGAPED